MTYLQAILLGIVQGLTEFLPVSSSGHLVLTQHFLNVGEATQGVTFELAVHIGTLCSVLIYFRGRLWDLTKSLFTTAMTAERKLILYLFIGTIPAVIAGLTLKSYFEAAFENPVLTSAMLIVTGLVLLSTLWIRQRDNKVGPRSALFMGIGQACAILPGISRSGSTIVAGIASGVSPKLAAEFSFLLAIPAIAGAAVLQAKDVSAIDQQLVGPYIAGTIAAFVFGLIAVYLVLASIRRGKFQYFGYYCIAIGLFGLIFFLSKSS